MKNIAQFEKVSFEQFKKSIYAMIDASTISDERLLEIYNKIELPTRSTSGSAGYDFKSFCWFEIRSGQTVTIPTGIKAHIDDEWFLSIVPRSSFGFKYRVQLDNTIGIIDGDYYNNDNNEGNIIVKLTNCSNDNKTLTVSPGDKFVQGIFIPYGTVIGDSADGKRNGGIGSTDAK